MQVLQLREGGLRPGWTSERLRGGYHSLRGRALLRHHAATVLSHTAPGRRPEGVPLCACVCLISLLLTSLLPDLHRRVHRCKLQKRLVLPQVRQVRFGVYVLYKY